MQTNHNPRAPRYSPSSANRAEAATTGFREQPTSDKRNFTSVKRSSETSPIGELDEARHESVLCSSSWLACTDVFSVVQLSGQSCNDQFPRTTGRPRNGGILPSNGARGPINTRRERSLCCSSWNLNPKHFIARTAPNLGKWASGHWTGTSLTL